MQMYIFNANWFIGLSGQLSRVITVNNTTMYILIDVLLENDKTTCFGQRWPSSGFYPKNVYAVRVFTKSTQMRIDVEISSWRILS